ncbi:MAG: DUF4358 domain-containing protein [Roseburia sp.]|nr:DUF4358 domain-containing protein [Roseburia sp.]
MVIQLNAKGAKNMLKKWISVVFAASAVLCMLTGCGETAPLEELVQRKEDGATGAEVYDVEAGSANVESGKTTHPKREFPTLSGLRERVKEEMGDHYWPEVPLSEEELWEKTGITEDMYVEFLAERHSVEADIDMMIIIHAKEDYVGAVEQALEEYRNGMIEDNQKYPQNYGKAQASRMETIEDYICFVQLGADTSVVADRGEREIIAYCQEENERAIDILEKTILQ